MPDTVGNLYTFVIHMLLTYIIMLSQEIMVQYVKTLNVVLQEFIIEILDFWEGVLNKIITFNLHVLIIHSYDNLNKGDNKKKKSC